MATNHPQFPTPEGQPELRMPFYANSACPRCGKCLYQGGYYVPTEGATKGEVMICPACFGTRAQSTLPEQRATQVMAKARKTVEPLVAEEARGRGEVGIGNCSTCKRDYVFCICPRKGRTIHKPSDAAHPEAVRMPPLSDAATRELSHSNLSPALKERAAQLLAALTELQTERSAHERTKEELEKWKGDSETNFRVLGVEIEKVKKAEAELESLRSELAAAREETEGLRTKLSTATQR